MEIKTIKLDEIFVKKQVRTVFNPETLKSLADSIKEKGVLQPILVKKLGDEYKIVAGERRFLASQEAGLEEIPACILGDNDNEKEIQLIENTQRENLNPTDLAAAFMDLRNDGKTLKEIALISGISERNLLEILSILELSEEDKEKIKNGEPYTKFTRTERRSPVQKQEKNTGIINNNDNLNKKSITPKNKNTVHVTKNHTLNQEQEQNQKLKENNMTDSNMNGVPDFPPDTENQEPEPKRSGDQRSSTSPDESQKIENLKPKDQTPLDLKSIKADPGEVLKTETDYPDYSNMPSEPQDEDEEPAEISPESLVNENGDMVDLQNRLVVETEDGLSVVIEPEDVKELLEKFNKTGYGFKINLGSGDALILTDINGTKNIYNIINCLAINMKDYI